MKELFYKISFILVCTLLFAACSDANIEEVDLTQEVDEEFDDDVSDAITIPDVNEDFKVWIAHAVKILDEDLNDPRLIETNHDEGFSYYLKSEKIKELRLDLDSYPENKGIQKDLNNIFLLNSMLSHEQFVRTSEFGLEGQAVEDTSYYDQWEPTPNAMREANKYMKEIFHDLEVAFHHNGDGNLYGVTHTLDGEHVDEVKRNTY